MKITIPPTLEMEIQKFNEASEKHIGAIDGMTAAELEQKNREYIHHAILVAGMVSKLVTKKNEKSRDKN